jgi:hypothetical protein
MKNQNWYTFQSEIAVEQIRDAAELNPDLKSQHFVVLIKDRNGPDLFKIRSVNFNGLRDTAKWTRDEQSRDEYYFNNYDAVDAPSKTNTANRVSHSKRGVTSYIPENRLVELLVEVHDSKVTANQTKDALTGLEANLVRRPPTVTPELKKVIKGKKFNIDTLTEELRTVKRYNTMFLATM